MPMERRFHSITFDEQACNERDRIRMVFESLEGMLDQLGKSRSQGKAYTKLEEGFMWACKAIKESQMKRLAEVKKEKKEKNESIHLSRRERR